MPCARNSAPPSFLASASNTSMNSLPMVLRFCSGSVTPSSAPRKCVRGVDVHQRDVVVAAEQIDDGLAFVQPQQAVIDEHAGELVADRLVDQHGGDRGIDAAGQPADHPALADLLADFLDRLVLEGAHGPVAAAAARSCARNCAGARRPAACASPRDGTGWRRTCASRRRSSRSAHSAEVPTTRKPSGSRVTRSPWLIQTG